MNMINLGPFALPVAPLVLLAATFVATIVARRSDGTLAALVENRLWLALVIGVLAARLLFVAVHLQQYGAAPSRIPDIRDGGFYTLAGLLATLAVAGWFAWRRADGRRVLLMAGAAGLATWAIGMAVSLLLLRSAPARLPELELQTLDGRPVALQALAGKPMVVNLWATWCPPCRREMPDLAAAQTQHKDVAFVFVNQGETAASVRRYLAQQGMAIDNVLLDAKTALGQAVGSRALPTTLFVDAHGKLVERHIGGLSAATLTQELGSLTGSP